MNRGRAYPYVLALVGGLTWGLTFSLARIATGGDAHPVGLTFWQAAFGALLLGAWAAVRGRAPGRGRRYYLWALVISIIGTALPGVLYFIAASRVQAGVLAITVATVPLITYGFSLLARLEGVNPLRFAGLMLGLIAIVVLVVPDTSLPDPAMAAWALLGVLCAVSFSVENLFVALKVPDHLDMATLLAVAMAFAAIILAAICLATGTFMVLAWPFTGVEWAIIAMAMINAAAYAMFLHLIHVAGPVFASITGYVVTVFGVIWGMVIFGESHSAWVWMSLAVLLTGVALVSPRRATPALQAATQGRRVS